MAIQDIIKELEELEKSSGGGGRTDTKKRKAEQEACMSALNVINQYSTNIETPLV